MPPGTDDGADEGTDEIDGERGGSGLSAGIGAGEESCPTAWSKLATNLVEFAEAQGVSRPQLLAAARLNDDALEPHQSRIPLRSVHDMLDAVARSTGDELVGLHLAQSVPNGIEVLGFLFLTSPTFGDALAALVRYHRFLADGESYRLIRGEREARLSIHHHGRPHPAQFHVTDLVFHELTAGSARRFGRSIPGARIELRRPPPDRPEAYRQIYGDRLVFGAGLDQIVIPAEALDLPLPGSNPEMRQYFQRQLEAEIMRLPSPLLAGRVHAWVEQNLESAPGLPDVARALGMSARTLQRRLGQQGQTLRQIVDSIRCERACEVLLATGTIAQTARRLGYSEPSAFHRAFKRWTGQTPGELLARHRLAE
ncbi:MAG: AraC family transcriptional regulator [Myxococcota bacterium]